MELELPASPDHLPGLRVLVYTMRRDRRGSCLLVSAPVKGMTPLRKVSGRQRLY